MAGPQITVTPQMANQNDPNRKVKIGWVGCGFIGQVAHLVNYLDIPNAEIVALADLRPDLGAQVCHRYNIPRFYSDHNALLEDPEIDAVVAVVRRHHTASVALDVLKSGKHLFAEKPMAPTFAQAEPLALAAKENQLCYSIGFMRRHDEGVQTAKRMLDEVLESGELGALLYLRSYCFAGGDYCNISGYIKTDEPAPNHMIAPIAPDWLPDDKHKDYEHFLNVCSHTLNLVRYLTGKRPSVSHVEYRRPAGGVVVMDFGEYPGVLEFCDISQNRWVEGVEIFFERGSLHLELPPAFLRNQPAQVRMYKETVNGPSQTVVSNPNWTWSFRREDEAFIQDILTGQTPVASGADSLEDHILIEEIWQHLA